MRDFWLGMALALTSDTVTRCVAGILGALASTRWFRKGRRPGRRGKR